VPGVPERRVQISTLTLRSKSPWICSRGEASERRFAGPVRRRPLDCEPEDGRVACSSIVAQKSCPQTTSNWPECESLLEKQLLKKFPKLVRRDGPTLVIRWADVSPDIFVDGEVEKDDESSYAASA
jgi:hypothetical protein